MTEIGTPACSMSVSVYGGESCRVIRRNRAAGPGPGGRGLSPRGPLLTFDRGDEAVGVDEADSQRTDLTPEE